MLGQLAGEVDGLMGSPLRHHHNTPNLLHLGVVWGTHPIEVACNLGGGDREAGSPGHAQPRVLAKGEGPHCSQLELVGRVEGHRG